MNAPIVECRGVSAGYRSIEGDTREVLGGVSFAMAAGDVIVIVGASGSGKSTLLRVLNRFEDPIEGEVRLGGTDLRQLDPLAVRRRVTFVLQTPVMFDGTVRENLLARPRGSPLPSETFLARTVHDVGLDDSFLDRNAKELSVGEKQRVAIARALVGEPEVLLLDEPTSALDPKNRAVLASLVRDLNQTRGVSVVCVTHDADLVRKLAGRRFMLRAGALEVDVDEAGVEAFLEAPE